MEYYNCRDRRGDPVITLIRLENEPGIQLQAFYKSATYGEHGGVRAAKIMLMVSPDIAHSDSATGSNNTGHYVAEVEIPNNVAVTTMEDSSSIVIGRGQVAVFNLLPVLDQIYGVGDYDRDMNISFKVVAFDEEGTELATSTKLHGDHFGDARPNNTRSRTLDKRNVPSKPTDSLFDPQRQCNGY